MITDDELENLPDDPQEAFLKFERIAREHLDQTLYQQADSQGSHGWTAELDYMSSVVGAAKVFAIEELSNTSLPGVNANIGPEYEQFRADVSHLCIQLRLAKKWGGKKDYVSFDPPTKMKLRHLLDQVRAIVDDEQRLTPRKKAALVSKIAGLSAEIDSDWSRSESVGQLFLEIAGITGEAANRMEPARKLIESIAAAFGKAKREQEDKRLPGSERKRIPPPKRDERKVLDDEIPF